MVLFLSLQSFSQEAALEPAAKEESTFDPKLAVSTVEKIQGLYIFAYGSPQAKNKVIGTIDLPWQNSDYWLTIEKMIKKAKKTYPTASGLIIKVSMNSYKVTASVIEFIE